MADLEKVITNIGQIGKTLDDIQQGNVRAILSACEKHVITNPNQIAYILATAYHEARLKPVEEIGKGKGRPYGSKFKQAKINGVHVPYTTPDQLYYGRGLVQLTWYENYETFGKLLSIDLLNNPNWAMGIDASEIVVVGMQKGMFTGVGLPRFFSDNISDPVNARKIINGLDCADLIAGYYNHILSVLS